MQDGTPGHLPPEYLNFKAVLVARRTARSRNLQPASARFVLEVIAGYSNGSPARPSYETIAGDTGLGVHRVRMLVDTLVTAGYLTETRSPRKGGGWGKPMWALGHTCQVFPHAHLPQEQVLPDAHLPADQVCVDAKSSVRPDTLASVRPDTPKRKDREENHEEKGATAPLPPAPAVKPAPKPPSEKQLAVGHPRVQAFFDGLRAGGGKHPLEGTLTGQDFKMIKEGDFDAGDLGACCRATADGTWPGADAWIKERLSVANVHKYRYGRWIARTTPTAAPATDGRPSRVQSTLARMEMMRAEQETDRDDLRSVRPTLPAPRDALRAAFPSRG